MIQGNREGGSLNNERGVGDRGEEGEGGVWSEGEDWEERRQKAYHFFILPTHPTHPTLPTLPTPYTLQLPRRAWSRHVMGDKTHHQRQLLIVPGNKQSTNSFSNQKILLLPVAYSLLLY